MEPVDLNTFPILVTERLILRQLSDSDVQEIFRLRSDASINKYLDRKPSENLGDALEFIKKIKANSFSYWGIVQKGSERLVGTICLFDISEELKKCEIGYELLPEHQGKGIMTEAAKKVIEHSFLTLGLNTMEAYTHKDNKGSTNLLKVLGFERIDSVDEKNSDLVLFRFDISGASNAA